MKILQQPKWLPHKGYWRLLCVAQVLGFLAVFIPFARDAMVNLDNVTLAGLGILTLIAISLSVGAALVVRAVGWVTTWVIQGFKETKKS